MRQLTNSLFFTLGALLGSQVKLRFDNYQQPRPMPHQWGRLLEHPLRLRYRQPTEVLGDLGFAPDMTVLDLGCGTGLFTVAMAQMVGTQGRIHAVEMQKPLISQAQARAQALDLQTRIHFHNCGAYQLPIETSSIDLGIVIATLSQIPDKVATLAELRRVLKPGARLAISEELPDPAYIPPQIMRRWLAAAGYRFIAQSGTFFCYTQLYIPDKEPNTVDVTPEVISIDSKTVRQ